jgi:probable HAF family extracellular repeat protein
MRDIGTLSGPSIANAVNDSDEIVGRSAANDGTFHGFLYSRATNTILDLGPILAAAGFGGAESTAVGINNAGHIVGGATIETGAIHAFLWHRPSGSILDIHSSVSFGGANSKAFSISDSGKVVGLSEDADGNQLGFIYDINTSSVVRLGTLGGRESAAVAVNAAGHVTGAADLALGGAYHAYLSAGQGPLTAAADIGTLGGSESTGMAINDGGVVVGAATDADAQSFAFIYDAANGLRNIETLLLSNPGWILIAANAINNQGQIAGNGYLNRYEHAFIMTVADTTAPVITHLLSPAPVDGWNRQDVTVQWTVNDAESGIATETGCDESQLVAETNGVTLTCSATNGVGLNNSASVVVKIDKTAPAIAITSPADGASYVTGATLPVTYSCADARSGVSTCSGPVASGSNYDTSAVGANKTITVTSTDAAGNASSRTSAFSIVYAFSGFRPPVQAAPALNSASAGQRVPVKWQLRDAKGSLISDLGSLASISSRVAACDLSGPTLPAEPAASSGGSVFRYDSAAGQFIFDWQTSKSWTGCRVLQIQLKDGKRHEAIFSFQ